MSQKRFLHACPPLAVLLLVGAAIGMREREIAWLKGRSDTLRQRIERAAHSAESAAVGRVVEPVNGASPVGGKRIDWKKIAMLKAQAGQEDVIKMRAELELQQALLDLSPQQLLAQLDEIAALDLPGETRRELENTIVDILGRKDPQLALDRFAGQLSSNQNWRLAKIFERWLTKDAGAAAAWMDRQIAAGAFESKSLEHKNDSRKAFEGMLIREWLANDFAAARERVTALPEPLRSDVLGGGLFSKLQGGNEKKVADLIRDSAGNAPEVLAQSSAVFAFQGFDCVGQFMKTIEASPKERNAIAAKTVSMTLMNDGWTQSDPASVIETARTWAQQEAPGAADRITGDALARLGEDHFNEAAELALRYQESSGDDAVLVAFLKNDDIADEHRDEALSLVERIADPVKREEVRKLFSAEDP